MGDVRAEQQDIAPPHGDRQRLGQPFGVGCLHAHVAGALGPRGRKHPVPLADGRHLEARAVVGDVDERDPGGDEVDAGDRCECIARPGATGRLVVSSSGNLARQKQLGSAATRSASNTSATSSSRPPQRTGSGPRPLGEKHAPSRRAVGDRPAVPPSAGREVRDSKPRSAKDVVEPRLLLPASRSSRRRDASRNVCTAARSCSGATAASSTLPSRAVGGPVAVTQGAPAPGTARSEPSPAAAREASFVTVTTWSRCSSGMMVAAGQNPRMCPALERQDVVREEVVVDRAAASGEPSSRKQAAPRSRSSDGRPDRPARANGRSMSRDPAPRRRSAPSRRGSRPRRRSASGLSENVLFSRKSFGWYGIRSVEHDARTRGSRSRSPCRRARCRARCPASGGGSTARSGRSR